jgi:hypothetical protein
MPNFGYESSTAFRNVDIRVLVKRRNIPEDFNPQQYRCKNLKSRTEISACLLQNNQHFSLNIY